MAILKHMRHRSYWSKLNWSLEYLVRNLYHILSGLKRHKVTISQFWPSDVQTGSSLDSNQDIGRGLPWWSSAQESACQCWGRGSNPWSGKISHATGQRSPCVTATEDDMLWNLRAATTEAQAPTVSATGEAPAHHN